MSGLTEDAIKKLPVEAKAYKKYDAEGLYIHVMPTGSKMWRWKYHTVDGREKVASFGKWPATTIKLARKKLEAAQKLLAEGKDPNAVKADAEGEHRNTFAIVANAWLAMYRKKEIDQGTYDDVKRQIDLHLMPVLGNRPIRSLTPKDALAVLDPIGDRGNLETMHRCKRHLSRIFQYAHARGMVGGDITLSLIEALPVYSPKSLPGFTDPTDVGGLLRAIDDYQGQAVTVLMLRLMPHVALRTHEIRHGEWSQVKWDLREWHVPVNVMKMRRPHIVPLSRQALAILKQLHEITGDGKLMFPQPSKPRPVSDNAINSMLRNMGYDTKTQHCGHGFRTTFSTLLNENKRRLGIDSDWIEMQLAHVQSDKIRGIYNQALYLEDRHVMMQQWSDYLDQVKVVKQQQRRAA